jgi:hypothetical protein
VYVTLKVPVTIPGLKTRTRHQIVGEVIYQPEVKKWGAYGFAGQERMLLALPGTQKVAQNLVKDWAILKYIDNDNDSSTEV